MYTAVLLIVLFSYSSLGAAVYYIYPKIDSDLYVAAQALGQRAKVIYIDGIAGVADEKKRKSIYLDGLELCNSIYSEQVPRILERTNLEARAYDTMLLEQIGLKHFTAQFMTVQPEFMNEVVHMACSKHEQQLQCGAVFEGDAVTWKRIEDLRTIGNHKMMFDYECNNGTFATSIYPCVGHSVATWSEPCAELMQQYSESQRSVNAEIAKIYETALNAVKKLKPRAELSGIMEKFVFRDAMRKIANLEGGKCELFKKMRQCVIPVLERQCGKTAAMAVNTSISLGYLRTERKERLNLDFANFKFFEDPRCSGL